MSLRFPGPAAPATTPLRWSAWTRGAARTLAFPGEAMPAEVPLRWPEWTPSGHGAPAAGEPVVRPRSSGVRPTAGTQGSGGQGAGETSDPPPRRAATAAHPSPHPPAATAAHTPLGSLADAMARNHAAMASAHETFLAAQQAHLDLAASVHARLTALAERLGD